jgi:hypothetical protein
VANWNASGQIGVVRVEIPPIKEAVGKFFEDATARGLRPPTIQKLRILLEKRLIPWCEDRGYRLLKQLDVDALRQFRATWAPLPFWSQSCTRSRAAPAAATAGCAVPPPTAPF